MAKDLGTSAEERIAELERTLETLREDTEVAHVLLGLSGALAEVKSVAETLDTAVRIVPGLYGADRCFSATRDRESKHFAVLATGGFDPDAERRLVATADRPGGLPFLETALREQTPVLVSDVLAEGGIGPEEAGARRLGAFIGIPLVSAGQEYGVLGVEFEHPRRFGSKDLALALGIARQFAMALANARRFALLRALREFGIQVGSKLRLEAVGEEIMRGARDLLAGNAAALYFYDAANNSLMAVGGSDASFTDTLPRIEVASGPWSSLLSGRIVTIPGTEAGVVGGPSTVIAAPIPGGGEPLVATVLVLFDRTVALSPDEAEALSVLTAQSATAIENARRYERQRRVARSLQSGLLAVEMPELERCEVGAVYEAASAEADVGGDFFDVFEVPGDRLAIVVGDVSGKGAEAAAQTAMAKYMLRAFAARNPTPASALFHLNNALAHDMRDDRFTTVVYAVVDPSSLSVVIAGGGHPAPLVYRCQTDTVESLQLQGSILGAFEDEQFTQETFELTPGDVLVAYTDGLLEARNDGEFYGLARLEASLARHARTLAGKELAQRIYEDAKEFGPILDDSVVLALSCKPDEAG